MTFPFLGSFFLLAGSWCAELRFASSKLREGKRFRENEPFPCGRRLYVGLRNKKADGAAPEQKTVLALPNPDWKIAPSVERATLASVHDKEKVKALKTIMKLLNIAFNRTNELLFTLCVS